MRNHSIFLLIVAAVALLITASLGQKTVNKAAAPQTSASSGADMYANYCASCHGRTGKGDGPAASALKIPPSDLTTLSKGNGAKFPWDRVSHVLSGETEVAAHGSKDMPVWGPVLRAVSHGDQAVVQLRISNLTKYVESLQAK